MLSHQKHQLGVTLLEIMLVLAIATSLIVLALRTYYQFRFQREEQQIAYTVNQIFQAMTGYYRANCRQTLDANSVPQSTGALDPRVTDTSGIITKYAIPIQNTLITPGFIPANAWHPGNFLVDDSVATNGYYAQYNRVLSGAADPVMNVYACAGSTRPPSCDVTNGAVLASLPNKQTSQVVTWVIQVSVKLSPALSLATQTQIQNDLSADCNSTAVSAGAVALCSTNPKKDGYLVWTRIPSAYHPGITGDYSSSLPYVQDFNRQYTNDGMANLSGVTNETQSWYNPYTYLCGG